MRGRPGCLALAFTDSSNRREIVSTGGIRFPRAKPCSEQVALILAPTSSGARGGNGGDHDDASLVALVNPVGRGFDDHGR
jgi:hypothetical protein